MTARKSLLSTGRIAGFPVVISGPSGAGKTSLCKMLRRGNKELFYSVSATTRRRRKGERQGRDYVLVDQEEFDRMRRRREFLEWARVHGECYGTLRKPVEQNIDKGRIVILDVDVQGGRQLQKVFKNGVFVYILPPSWKVLRERLSGRGTESPRSLARRLKDAREELSYLKHYSYVVVNDDLKQATQQLKAIISAELCRVERYVSPSKFGRL